MDDRNDVDDGVDRLARAHIYTPAGHEGSAGLKVRSQSLLLIEGKNAAVSWDGSWTQGLISGIFYISNHTSDANQET